MHLKRNILFSIILCGIFILSIPINVFAADNNSSNFGQNINNSEENNQNEGIDLQAEMDNISSSDINSAFNNETNNVSSIDSEYNKLAQDFTNKGYGSTAELNIPEFKTGYTSDIESIFNNAFGDIKSDFNQIDTLMPENFTFDQLVAKGDAMREAAGADFKDNQLYKDTLEEISIGKSFNLVSDKMLNTVSLSSPDEMYSKLNVVAAGLNSSYESALSTVKSLAGVGGATTTKEELSAQGHSKYISDSASAALSRSNLYESYKKNLGFDADADRKTAEQRAQEQAEQKQTAEETKELEKGSDIIDSYNLSRSSEFNDIAYEQYKNSDAYEENSVMDQALKMLGSGEVKNEQQINGAIENAKAWNDSEKLEVWSTVKAICNYNKDNNNEVADLINNCATNHLYNLGNDNIYDANNGNYLDNITSLANEYIADGQESMEWWHSNPAGTAVSAVGGLFAGAYQGVCSLF